MKQLCGAVIILAMLCGAVRPAAAQDDGKHPVITPENAAQLKQVGMLGRGWINDVAWSANGEHFAVGSSNGVWLYEMADMTAAPQYLPTPGIAILAVAFSADSELVAAASMHQIWIWEVERLAEKKVIQIDEDFSYYTEYVYSMSFSPNGRWVVLVSYEGMVIVEVMTGAIVTLLGSDGFGSGTSNTAHFVSDDLLSLQFNDASVLVNISQLIQAGPRPSFEAGQAAIVQKWEAPDPQDWGVVQQEHGPSPQRAVSREEHYLAFATCDDPLEEDYDPCDQEAVKVWEIASRKLVLHKSGFGEPLEKLSFSPDSRLFAAATSNEVRIFDMQSGQRVAVLDGYGGPVEGLAFSSDSSRLVTSHYTDVAWFWDLTTMSTVAGLPCYGDIALHPDDDLLVCVNGNWICAEYVPLQIWNVAEMEHPHLTSGYPRFDCADNVSFSPNGKYLLLHEPYLYVVLETDNWTIAKSLYTGASALLSYQEAAHDLESRPLVVGEELSVPPLKDLKLSFPAVPDYVLGDKTPDEIGGVALSPDERLLAVTTCRKMGEYYCERAGLSVWDIQSEILLAESDEIEGFPGLVTFNPAGTLLAFAVCSEKGMFFDRRCAKHDIHVWDVAQQRPLTVLEGHTDNIWKLQFSPDGRWLASGSGYIEYYWSENESPDSTVRLWAVP